MRHWRHGPLLVCVHLFFRLLTSKSRFLTLILNYELCNKLWIFQQIQQILKYATVSCWMMRYSTNGLLIIHTSSQERWSVKNRWSHRHQSDVHRCVFQVLVVESSLLQQNQRSNPLSHPSIPHIFHLVKHLYHCPRNLITTDRYHQQYQASAFSTHRNERWTFKKVRTNLSTSISRFLVGCCQSDKNFITLFFLIGASST